MALAITKNDISGVYGNPAPLKITKSDISSVYAKTPATAGYYSALSKPPIVKGRWQNDSFDGGVTAKQQSLHKTATLSDTSPFTIIKSDINTIYSAPKTADAKTDRIHKMYSDYVKKQEEEIKSNQLIPKIKDTAKGLSNIGKIKDYFPKELSLDALTDDNESIIMMKGFRNNDKPMGFFHLDEPHNVDGKPVGYHINTLKDKEFDWVTLTPLQEKTLKKLSHKEIPESAYNALKKFDDVAKNIKSAGKAVAVAGIVFDTYEFAKTAYNDLTDEDGKLGQDTAEMVAGAAAGWAGGAIGTKLGAVGGSAIGTAICPGLGTVIGGFIGGSFGGIIGSTAGRESGEFLVNEMFGE